jgi:O-antigen/teichoic acid export membrane protein
LIVSNMFGPLGLSKFGIVQTTITTVASVLPFGLGYTAINYINKSRDDGFGLDVANFAYQTCFIVSLVSAVLLALLAGPFSRQFYSDDSLSIFIVFAAIGLPFAAISFIQYALLNGFEAYADMARSAFVSAAATVGLVAAGAWMGGLMGAIYGFLLTLIIRAVLLQWSLNRFCTIKRSLPSREVWRKIKHFAIPAGLAGLSLTPSTWYANSLLIKYEGLEAQGIMMAALTVRMAISFIPQQLSTVLLPQYIQAEGEPARQHGLRLLRYVGLLAGSTLGLCSIAFVIRDPLIAAFGEGFTANSAIFGLLLLSVVLEAMALPLSYFYARREQMWRYLFTFTYPKDLTLVIASIILVPDYGAMGLAQAYVIAITVGFALLGLTSLWTHMTSGKMMKLN